MSETAGPVMCGVYMIAIKGTPLVYVGESSRIGKRWREHERRWVWPNEADYTIVRSMPGSSRSLRMKTELALIRLLKRRGMILLSNVVEEYGVALFTHGQLSAAGKIGASKLTREHRVAGARALNASRSQEEYKRVLAKAHSTMPQRASAMAMIAVANRRARAADRKLQGGLLDA